MEWYVLSSNFQNFFQIFLDIQNSLLAPNKQNYILHID